MDYFVEWIKFLIFAYPALKYIAIFFGSGFGGELGVLALAFLAAQKIYSISSFFIISFIAVIITDSLWFYLGRNKSVDKVLSHKHVNDTVVLITKAIYRVSRGSHFFAFIFTKFLIGTRVVLIFYISKTDITYKNYMRYNIPAIFIWLVILTIIGYLSGLGFTYISLIQNIYDAIGFVILIFVVFTIAQLLFERYFKKEGAEILEKENVI